MPPNQIFSGEITVSSRIVDYLSSGLYESPAACLKELINNSYDADAREVNIFIKPDADRIIIEDDGTGMSRVEFEKHFRRISESHKRDDGDNTASGRFKIGKIGIGFIAANEICEVMEIFSTKKGSTELLHVNINFGKMRLDLEDRKREGDDIAKADYEGETEEIDRDSHFTRLFLKDVRGEAKEILASAGNLSEESSPRSLYGLSALSVAQRLSDPALRSWSQFDTYSQNLLRVALNIPVPYHDHWLPKKFREKVKDLEERTSELDFHVYYDGCELRKPIILSPDEGKGLISKFTIEGKNVIARGYFFVRSSAVKPQDLNGILIRIRHASVGYYDSTFMDFPITVGTVFQKWISAEIWANDQLEDALNIDRKTLRSSHPAYVELQKEIHKKLSQVIKRTREEIYGEGRAIKKKVKVQATVRAIREFAKKDLAPINPKAARELLDTWKPAPVSSALQQRLIKRFDVESLYRLVLDVAKEILTPSQLTKFIRELTKRLRG